MTTITLSLDDSLAVSLRHMAAQQLISDEEILRRALKQYLQITLQPQRTFSDLYGAWKGVNFSYEEIKANEFKSDPNL